MAFVDSGAVDNVLLKSVCTEYPLEATSKSQSGVGFEGANGSLSSQDKRWKQYEHHVGGRRCAQTAGLRQPSARERGHKLVLDEKPRIQCKNGDTIPLERTGSLLAVRLCSPKGF